MCGCRAAKPGLHTHRPSRNNRACNQRRAAPHRIKVKTVNPSDLWGRISAGNYVSGSQWREEEKNSRVGVSERSFSRPHKSTGPRPGTTSKTERKHLVPNPGRHRTTYNRFVRNRVCGQAEDPAKSVDKTLNHQRFLRGEHVQGARTIAKPCG